MKLFKYQTLEELNAALEFFAKEKTPIKKVKICTESEYIDQYRRTFEVTRYFVLTDEKESHKPKKKK